MANVKLEEARLVPVDAEENRLELVGLNILLVEELADAKLDEATLVPVDADKDRLALAEFRRLPEDDVVLGCGEL